MRWDPDLPAPAPRVPTAAGSDSSAAWAALCAGDDLETAPIKRRRPVPAGQAAAGEPVTGASSGWRPAGRGRAFPLAS